MLAYFVRHAQSAANAGWASNDPTSIPLTPAGLQQSETFATAFPFAPGLIASSPYLRARQTASPLISRFPMARTDILPIQEFTYLAPTNWRGSTPADRRPAVEAFWRRADPDRCDGDGAESFAQFVARIDACLGWIQRGSVAPIVLVSHEMFIRGVMWRRVHATVPITLEAMREFRASLIASPMANLAITAVSSTDHAP